MENINDELFETQGDLCFGEQKFIVVLAKFNGKPEVRYSKSDIIDMMDTSDVFWRNVSENQISISATVHGLYQLPKSQIQYGDEEHSFREVVRAFRRALQLVGSSFISKHIDFAKMELNCFNHFS